jgi:hypothetical protein
MAVWKNAQNGHTVLAIKGTNPDIRTAGGRSDLNEDRKLTFGVGAKAASDAVRAKAREFMNTYGVNLVTGHSLGGYHTEIVATNEGLPGIAFCAPGSNGSVQ